MNLSNLSVHLFAGAVAFSAACQETTPPARLPPVIVQGTNAVPGELNEEQPFGSNDQPEWTTRRPFATTRIYVLPPWQMEFEQWWKGQWPRDGRANHLFQSEVEIGLPYRFQVDFYQNIERTDQSTFQHQGTQVEARWALADWGKIPFNPTLYGEWIFNDDVPDKYEVKLLLGDDLAPRWHWGVNVFYEQEVGGERGSESGIAAALSYAAIDERLGIGVEAKVERTSAPNLDGRPATEIDIGPSIQWRPTRRTHLDLVPLLGIGNDSPALEAWIVFGFDFGPGGGHEILSPTSTRGR